MPQQTIDGQNGDIIDNIKSSYTKFFQKIRTPSRTISAVLLLAMILLLMYGITTREIESLQDFGVGELALVFSIWIIFVELPNVSYAGDQIQVSYFYRQASARIKYYMDIVHHVIVAAGTLLLLISSLLVALTYTSGTTSVIGLPRLVYAIPLVYGFALLMVICWFRLYYVLSGHDDARDETSNAE